MNSSRDAVVTTGRLPPPRADVYPLAWLLSAALMLLGYWWDSGYGSGEQGDEVLSPTLAIIRPVDLLLVGAAAALGLSLLAWRVILRLSGQRPRQSGLTDRPAPAIARHALPVGLALCAATLLAGALNAVVLGPLAQAPGHDLAAIYEAIRRAFGSRSLVFDLVIPLGWFLVWAGIAVTAAVLLRRRAAAWNHALAALLGLAGVALLSEFIAGAPMSMDVADALARYGTPAPFAFYLWVAGRIMLCGSLLLASLGSEIRTRRR